MKQKKRRVELFSFYDHSGMEAHLAAQAQRGWLLEKLGRFCWVYRRVAPQKLTFAVTYAADASVYDPGPTQGQQDYRDMAARTGWQRLSASGKLQVYCTADPAAIPLETDPATQVEAIHRAVRWGFLGPYCLLAVLGLWSLGMQLAQFLRDPIGFLSSSNYLVSSVCWLTLLVLSAVELAAYGLWLTRARRDAAQGRFRPTPHTAPFQRALLIWVMLLFALWLADTLFGGDRIGRWAALISLGYIVTLLAAVNGVLAFLRWRNTPRSVTRAVTLAVDVVLAFLLMGLITYATLRLSDQGFFRQDSPPSQVADWQFRQLPLTVEDLVEVSYDGYLYQRSGSDSPLLGQFTLSQWPEPWGDDPDALAYPTMDYTATLVHLPALYGLCRAQLLAEKDETNDPAVPEGFKRQYLPTDPAPWGAEAAYRLTYQDTGPLDRYLLCYPSCLVELRLDWTPTAAQMATVGQTLGR